MRRIDGTTNVKILVSLAILVFLAGCSEEDSLAPPVDTPEGSAYAAFEVHRNSLGPADVDITYRNQDIEPALLAVGLHGRGLMYPNDYFATPLLLQSTADFKGIYYYDDDLVLACGEGEDGASVVRAYFGEGWTNITHSSTGKLTAISEVFFCSDEGEILELPGQSTELVQTFQAPPGVRFNDISCPKFSATIQEVVAVGDDGRIYHRFGDGDFIDESIPGGPDFIAISGEYIYQEPSEFLAISNNEIWEFSGGSWSLEYRNPGVTLNGVQYLNNEGPMAVGNGGLILQSDGVDWVVESLGDDVDLVAIGRKSEILEICGSKGEVYRQNGRLWSNLHHHASGPWPAFFTSSDGTRYAANGNKLMRFDVDDWFEEVAIEGYEEIADFHVVAPDQIWALVEMAGGFDQYVFFYNGSNWTFMRQSSLDEYSAIWCDAAGDNVFLTAGHGQIFWYHGGVWELAVNLGTSDAFHALVGSDMDNLLAVGDSGLIMRRGPGGWTDESHATTHALRAISLPLVAGDGGTILRQVNGVWQAVDMDFDGRFNGVWYGGDDNIWAVGDDAGVMHYDGTAWTRLLTHLPGIDFLATTGASADQVWIGGTEGYLLRSPEDEKTWPLAH